MMIYHDCHLSFVIGYLFFFYRMAKDKGQVTNDEP